MQNWRTVEPAHGKVTLHQDPQKRVVRYTVYSFGGWPNSWDTAGLGAAADVLWNILEMDGSPPGKMC